MGYIFCLSLFFWFPFIAVTEELYLSSINKISRMRASQKVLVYIFSKSLHFIIS